MPMVGVREKIAGVEMYFLEAGKCGSHLIGASKTGKHVLLGTANLFTAPVVNRLSL